jgi:hypothetical protein
MWIYHARTSDAVGAALRRDGMPHVLNRGVNPLLQANARSAALECDRCRRQSAQRPTFVVTRPRSCSRIARSIPFIAAYFSE